MPGTGYDKEAMRIGSARSGTRPWWLKIVVLVVAIAAGASLASLFK